MPGFYITSAIFFGIWWLLSSRLRYWSLRQDETGERALHAPDAFPFGLGDCRVRADADLLRRALDEGACNTNGSRRFMAFISFPSAPGWRWRRSMSSPCSCNASASSTACCTTTSFISSACCSSRSPSFPAYNEFAQYFVVWNANMPEETFWYLIREHGSWWWVSMVLIFGHFFAAVLRAAAGEGQDQFQNHAAGLRLGVAMNFLDLSLQHPAGAASATAIRSNGSGCNSAASRSWADFSVGRS